MLSRQSTMLLLKGTKVLAVLTDLQQAAEDKVRDPVTWVEVQSVLVKCYITLSSESCSVYLS